MDLWKIWDFRGDLALGVVDQRSDAIETPEVIRERLKPALAYFAPERLLLTSECGFGHVPIEITRAKLSVLTQTCRELRSAH
jgi:5-methyltetrahydropteroyltriglutamate--homocysteine methyltransferase